MIVQSAATAHVGQPRFVMRMTEHTAFARKLAEHFGNDTFEPVRPRSEMLFVAGHHDQGWAEWDAAPEIDPETGLPYHLVRTPRPVTLETGVASADFNEAHHPYCGLLSSMHIWGLYNGRYGYSDQVLIDSVPTEYRAAFREMLDGQLARQERLKAELAEKTATAPWVEEAHLFQNYKQLQFFDTLALYFHCAAPGTRGEAAFKHVPKSGSEDVTVTVRPAGNEVYAFAPYPFDADPLELSFEGRYLTPEDVAGNAAGAMRDTATSRQTVTFTAA